MFQLLYLNNALQMQNCVKGLSGVVRAKEDFIIKQINRARLDYVEPGWSFDGTFIGLRGIRLWRVKEILE